MRMTAYCGLDFEECSARTALLNDDDLLREETAAEWSKLFSTDIKPEHVNCTGCKEEGIKFPHCEHGCFMRKCAMKKGFDHCAQCVDYPCEELTGFFTYAPEAKIKLDKLIH